MKNVVIIRDRGQMTIPDSIRKSIKWTKPLSVVSIAVTKPDEIVLRPDTYKNEVDWDKLWKLIKKSRSIKGKGKGSAAKFIEKDRQSH